MEELEMTVTGFRMLPCRKCGEDEIRHEIGLVFFEGAWVEMARCESCEDVKLVSSKEVKPN